MLNIQKSNERLKGFVKKGWGHEYIIITNELYCAKILHFNNLGNCFSMHFHKEKDETWFVLEGRFLLTTIDTGTGSKNEEILETDSSRRIKPFEIHQLTALEDNSRILEVSTADSIQDNFRVMPGDSQDVY